MPPTLIVGCLLACVNSAMTVVFRRLVESSGMAWPSWPLAIAVGCLLGSQVLFGHGMFALASRHHGAVRRCLQASGVAWWVLLLWGCARYLSNAFFTDNLVMLSFVVWLAPVTASAAALWFARRRGAALATIALNAALMALSVRGWSWMPFSAQRAFFVAVSIATIALLGGLGVPALAEPERGRRALRRVASGMWIGVIAAIQWALTTLIETSRFGYFHRDVLDMGRVASAVFAASSLGWCAWGALDAARGLVNEQRRLAIAAGAMVWCAAIAVIQALNLYLRTYRGGQDLRFLHESLTFAAPAVFVLGLGMLLTAMQHLAAKQNEPALYLLLFQRRLSICLLAIFAAAIAAWGVSTGGLGEGAPGVFVVLALACKIPALGMAAHVIRSTADVLAPDVPAARIVGLGEALLTPAAK